MAKLIQISFKSSLELILIILFFLSAQFFTHSLILFPFLLGEFSSFRIAPLADLRDSWLVSKNVKQFGNLLISNKGSIAQFRLHFSVRIFISCLIFMLHKLLDRSELEGFISICNSEQGQCAAQGADHNSTSITAKLSINCFVESVAAQSVIVVFCEFSQDSLLFNVPKVDFALPTSGEQYFFIRWVWSKDKNLEMSFDTSTFLGQILSCSQ